MLPPMQPGEDTAALLASVEIFAHLEERELAEIASVAVPRSFERGEVLFREGDSGDTSYVIRSGAVVIRRDHASGSGKSLTLAEFRVGAFFGELAMFGGEVRSATAEALEPTSVVALLGPDMQRVMRSNPEISVKMLQGLAERLRHANERLLQQSFQTVSGRVASALLNQVVARQSEGAGDREVLVIATQAEIAQLAGTSRESASRFLASLEREGVVRLGRGKLTVDDPERLRNYIH
jgi:CRP/FNR family transcriptional regulator, cyclic AMP receptor protein